jgi:hypothetical protein
VLIICFASWAQVIKFEHKQKHCMHNSTTKSVTLLGNLWLKIVYKQYTLFNLTKNLLTKDESCTIHKMDNISKKKRKEKGVT